MQKINFIVSDKLVIDGYSNMFIDLSTNWNDVELGSPLSVDENGLVHPLVKDETFIGILSYRGIKNASLDIAGVNTIEVSYLRGGFYFNVRAKGTITVGDKLKADSQGFSVSADGTDAVCIAVSNAADGEIVKVRGGNY